ncbi:MAG: lysophospholipid acyltransferase family protein [Deltaproteobacteria bacterium]|nr:lysophospholipid acyltransferase family protein [Deltaproteobacteria bacterium]
MVALLKAVSYIIGHLPLGVLLFSGKTLGRLVYLVDKRHRKTAKENLKKAFGNEKTDIEIETIARKVFENIAMNFFEFMRVPWLKKSDLDGYVECEGFENFKEARSRGKGVMVYTAHLGNWELMAAYYGLMGHPSEIIVRDLDNPGVEEFVRWARSRCGNTIVSKERVMRKLIRRLSENAVVGILLDQNVAAAEGVFVDFFGTQACTNKGPAMLAAISGAAVIPSFIVRNGKKHKVVIGKISEVISTGDKEKDAMENTAQWTKTIEEVIRKRPEQWFWVHRRWKTRPQKNL